MEGYFQAAELGATHRGDRLARPPFSGTKSQQVSQRKTNESMSVLGQEQTWPHHLLFPIGFTTSRAGFSGPAVRLDLVAGAGQKRRLSLDLRAV